MPDQVIYVVNALILTGFALYTIITSHLELYGDDA